ncbi:sensor histidine kinase [Paenibacillus thalictri]|uniref:Signal transduction histidine kinase internal region domain-containing protein n=1 Tax=Paenibacillus thalictri TaxID=2527873 RepID=A0A4Q9DN09_9BACL|nr:sensor histidine kinase [Paenibacillus thalictri]TBL75667.1 hypothetical protein EYB31_21985 [Paenibacillus thalictri]
MPLFILGLIWYAFSTKEMENNVIYYNGKLLSQLNNQLDQYFAEIKADTQTIPGNPLIQEFVKLEPGNDYEMFQLKERIHRELYLNIMYRRKDIVGFGLYSHKDNTFGNLFVGDISPSFRDLQGMESNYNIVGVRQSNAYNAILIYRTIIDNTTYRPVGALLVAFSIDSIVKMTDDIAFGKEGYIAIVDSSNRFMYHRDPNKWGTEIPQSLVQEINSGVGQSIIQGETGKRIVMYKTSNSTGLTIVSEIPIKEVIGNLSHLHVITLMIGGMILIFAFIIFNKMLVDIKRLVGIIHLSRMKEKEMELRHKESTFQALQSQINPHFLYNSLEIINSYATLAKIKPICQMTQYLASIFRYSVSNPHQLVLLEDEINHITNYLNIQQERYANMRVTIDLEKKHLSMVCLFRLIVQPIVENAIIHGYERHGLHPADIVISGCMSDPYFSLRVTDRGKGMGAGVAARYNAAFHSEKNNVMDVSLHSSQKIGLWNVHNRLRLAFGAPYGLHILRSDEMGTEMEIKIPYTTSDCILFYKRGGEH